MGDLSDGGERFHLEGAAGAVGEAGLAGAAFQAEAQAARQRLQTVGGAAAGVVQVHGQLLDRLEHRHQFARQRRRRSARPARAARRPGTDESVRDPQSRSSDSRG